ncbi:hypothetical protein LZ518_08430 [Sphingomonas sp. RB56-2]|uniref:Uncharacterized protein n=1 Tax=Sphingomonas brevis TaxID=2908206 RepID=A0ABT0SAJ5_9SPHN|nr:hypothetical protein [Sphingomonas brevis]MCL6741155.1 hypothetical protein [Sphingomonas brevis]
MNTDMTLTVREPSTPPRQRELYWSRAIDEAETIGRELLVTDDRKGWVKRLDRLQARIDRLHRRQYDVDALVVLHPLNGVQMLVPLCEAPTALRALLEASQV